MGNIYSRKQKSNVRRKATVVPTITQPSTPVSTCTLPITKVWLPFARGSHHAPSPPSPVPKPPRLVPISYSSNKSHAGFLDLPAELRNKIYSQVLIYEGYIRVMRNEPTKVPALVLLQTCKQIHYEAASVFYAANSFYVATSQHVTLVIGRQPLSELYSPTLLGGEVGSFFFPAPRYHLYLTRLTIDAKIFLPDFFTNIQSRGFRRRFLGQVREQLIKDLEKQLLDVYLNMRALWEEKGRKWEGRLVSQENFAMRCLCVTLSFSEEAEEEVATRAAWRRID